MTNRLDQMYQPTSRYFRHVSRFAACDVVEIHAGYAHVSTHHYSDHDISVGPSPSIHTKDSIDRYIRDGRWIEITLDELLRRQGILTINTQLFADMHQIERDAPSNPLFPTKSQMLEQKQRAERFHNHWSHFHEVWQRQMRGVVHSWRYEMYHRDTALEQHNGGKVCGLARRMWLGQVGMFSDDAKIAFAAHFTALGKLLEDPNNNIDFVWAWAKLKNKVYQKALPFILYDAIQLAQRKIGDVWETPFFAGLNIKDACRWHFVHTSKSDPTKVAYAKDWRALWSLVDPTIETKTEATNKFVVTTPGRYLTKFYSDVLNETEIRDMAARCVAEALSPVLHVATTEKDIITAIAEGPTESCMANGYHKDDRKQYDWFNSPVHPAAIYASGDIEVLYLKTPAGEITARAIANASTKKVARIYGDQIKMLKAMSSAGYEQQTHALVGCRVRKITFDNDSKVVMAYVDAGTGSGGGSLYAYNDTDDKFLRLTADDSSAYNTYDGYNNRGYSFSKGECGDECACCGDEHDADDLTEVYGRQGIEIMVCDSCRDEHYVSAYGRRGVEAWHHRDRCVEVNDTYYVRQYAGDNGIAQATCGPSDGDWFNEDDLVYVADGRAALEDCTELDVEHDGYEWALDDDTTITADGYTIHTDVARKCVLTGDTWHKKDMIRLKRQLPGKVPGRFDNVWIYPASIVDNHEKVTVWYPIPMRAAVLIIDHPDIGFGVAEFDFSDEEFKNILYIGDDVDLSAALRDAYDEHHEETEELEAA